MSCAAMNRSDHRTGRLRKKGLHRRKGEGKSWKLKILEREQ
jgi:hypothetical protein